MIPNTAAGLLAIILVVLPGIPGDYVYRNVAGVSWREKEMRHLLRLLGYSVVGLAAYTIAAGSWNLPPPTYVFPSTFAGSGPSVPELRNIAIAYVGHLIGSGVAGLAGALFVLGLSKITPIGAQRDAWDHFVNKTSARRWVLVHLRTGEVYAGMLEHADIQVEPDYRDIILREPALFDETTGLYTSSTQQHVFLTGGSIASIATVLDPSLDARISPPGCTLFERRDADEDRDATVPTPSATPATGPDSEGGLTSANTDFSTKGAKPTTTSGAGEEVASR